MSIETDGYTSDLIDVAGISIRDLDELPESSLALALREVLNRNDVGTSAGFSSRLGTRPAVGTP